MSRKQRRNKTTLNAFRRVAPFARDWRSAASVTVLMLGGALVLSGGTGNAYAATPLPAGTLPNRPCSTSACQPFTPPAVTLGAGGVAFSNPGLDRSIRTLTVTQTAPKAVINWTSFDIASGSTVEFKQSNAGYIALNRIAGSYDYNTLTALTGPTTIQGNLTASGQLYLINQNGILFDRGSQINVNSLIAASLDVSDDLFAKGLLTAGINPVFSGGSGGFVKVEDGASITTPSGGRVMLLAPTVQNGGIIRTPDGQTILGAGQKVYLAASEDPSMRGLLIEVDAGGSATNLGQIVAERGNITLAGLAVNQSGRASATTSVNLNGSIRLLARDNATIVTNESNDTRTVPQLGKGVQARIGNHTGTVTLGAGSTTEVTLDADKTTTTTDAQGFQPSVVEVSGGRIDMQAGASIVAPSGNVSFKAVADPTTPSQSANSSRILIAAAAVIDVAGATAAQVAAERDSIRVELRGPELKDSPTQRNGFLRGKVVQIDASRGTTLADVSGYTAQIGRNVDERAAAGGSITLASEGDVITKAGSKLDVAGGQITHLAGFVKSTMLMSGGRVYDISDPKTPKDLVVDGFADSFTVTRPNGNGGVVTETMSNLVNSRGTYVTGYSEGKSAGTVKITGHALALDGALEGTVTPGPRQRSSSKLPVGGTLVIGDAGQFGAGAASFANLLTPDVNFVNARTDLPAGFGIDDALPNAGRVELTPEIFSGGFAKVGVYSNGAINVDTPLSGPAGGSLTLGGRAVNVNADIRMPAGSITLAARLTERDTPLPPDNLPVVFNHDVTLAAGVNLDTAGKWVNNSPAVNNQAGTEPLLIKGGSVALRAYDDVKLGANTRIDVAGGGALDSAGAFSAGDAGSIALAAAQNGRTVDNDNVPQTGAVSFGAGSVLSGFAAGKGGELNITTASMTIGAAARGLPEELVLAPALFTDNGFRKFNLTGLDGLVVADNTTLAPQVQTLTRRSGDTAQPSGARLTDFAGRSELSPALLQATELTLSSGSVYLDKTATTAGGPLAYKTGLTLGEGASITVKPGISVNSDGSVSRSSVTLNSGTSITLLGRVTAQGGTISLTTPAPDLTDPATDGQAVYLGAASRLDVSGVFVPKQSSSGLAQGDVRNGGDINLSVGRGFFMAAPRESDARPGATLDVSGGTGEIQMLGRSASSGMPEVVTQTVHGNAGSITLGAGSMLFDGNLKGGASGSAASGQLTINTGELALTQSGTSVPAGYSAGTPLAAADLGRARIALDTIAAGGFDTVNLAAATKISLNGSGGSDPLTAAPLALSLGARTPLAGRALTIDTPLLALDGSNSAAFAAPYIRLGNGAAGVASPAPNAAAGTGTLTFDADWIDIHGNLTLDNTAGVTMTSRGDIRFGVADTSVTGEATGGTLTLAADLTLKASQLYPATAASYTVNLRDAAGEPAHTLTILPGAAATPVLSAGGALTLKAAHIEQHGVVKAPFGQITLDTRRSDQTDSINLYAGSTTSVAGEGTAVPYGLVQNGSLWTYQNGTAAAQTVTATPAKQIALSGTAINLKTEAGKADPRLDLKGGGDIYAYEWTPGPGGSRDYLSADAGSGGLPAGAFALVPALQGKMAPFDPQYWNGAGFRMGDSVVLSGGGPLPAGEYLRLPARYALQPGAYLVTPVSGFQDIAPGSVVTRTDGTTVVAGKFGDTLAGSRDERWSGFVLTPGATVRQQSDYTDRYGSSFFSAAAPADAGRLSFNAVQTLRLDGAAGINLGGAFKLAADGSVVPTGRGGQLEISTPNDIAVVAGAPAASATRLELNATTLSGLGAASILLGGTRSLQADGTHIDVGAATVTVANDADHALRAPEILLAARNKVEIADGAKIDASGDAASGSALILPNSGALFAATAADLAAPLRSAPGSTGDLTIGKADIRAGGTLLFDATGKTTINDLATLSAPGVILSAGRIRLGAAPDSPSGLNLGVPILQQVSGADKLTLRSYSSIDFHGAFALGGASDAARPTISNLTLDTAGFGGYDTTALQTTSVRAGSVTLTNTNGVAASPFASAPNGLGTLRIIGAATTDTGAGRVVVGAEKVLSGNQKTLAGFSTVTLRAEGDVNASAADQAGKGEIVFEGAGKLQTAGNLKLEAPRISGGNGAAQTLTASGGSINITGSGGSVGAAGVGAQLTLNANSIDQSGLLDFASGIVNLNAGSGNVVVGSGGQINVRSAAVDFAGTLAHAPAGKVNLTASGGNVQIDGLIDISSAGGADAGLLAVSAPTGSLMLNGSVNGAAAGGYRRGSLTSDTATLTNFGALNAKLNAGNVGEQRTFRARTGNVTVDGTTTARNVAVSADAGSLSVTGTVDASGSDGAGGGNIALWARRAVNVSGQLRANGSDGGSGGSVTLGAGQRTAGAGAFDVNVAANTIDVAGGPGGAGGKVLVRAERIGTNDVDARLANNAISGAADVVVEAYRVYSNESAVNTARITAFNTDTTNYMTNAATIRTNAGIPAGAAGSNYHLRPGVELRSTAGGNITLANDWNLFSASRPGNEPGVLTIRADGNLTLASGSISDGFNGVLTTSTLQSGNSWSYRLVAGANSARPDPLALADSGSGAFSLGNGRMVRTGTGTIDIAAKGNITLGNATSVIYTAGVPTANPAGFTPNPVAAIAGDFPTGGGNISLNAGGDILGVDSKQLPSDWLYRQGQLDADGNYILQLTDGGNSDKVGSPGWWVKYSAFSQNVGALGGGNVRVTAGGRIDTLSVSIPTTGRVVGSNVADSTVQVQGGGDLRLTAGGDILNGVYYVGRGKGELDAGGTIGKSTASLVNPMLALGDGSFTLTARGDIALDGVFNPTLLPQARGNLGITSGAGTNTAAKTYFSTYAAASGVSVTSLNGDVTFLPQTSAGAARNATNITSWQGGCNATTNCALVFGNGEENLLSLLPGSLQAVSMNGNVGVRSSARITLAPSAEGQLALLAGNNVLISSLLMSDADPAVMGTPRNPLHTGATTTIPEDVGARTSVPHASTPVHQDDTAGPARIVAARGNIQPSSGNTLTLNLAKASELVAGNDITGLNLSVQNIHSDDVSRVSAGNDVSGRELRTASGTLGTNNNNITIGGPGTLVVQAGRDVDLGNSNGILSRGNLLNTALPEQGAGIVIIAGVKQAPDYDAFAASYLDPAQSLTRSCAAACAAPLEQPQTRALSATEQAALGKLKSLAPTAQYITRSYAAELRAFLGAAGNGLDDAAAYAAFSALKPDQRAAFVRQVFATELREAGRGVATGGDASYLRGYAAIGTLFPRSDYRGDIKMFYSQVKTERGGGVDLLVPGGLVNAGLAVPSTLQDNSKQLGIVTVLNGAVNAMVHDDFLVNQSRVFTLGGGGITIWSSVGGIDAGKGSKTATLASPPVIKVDSQGNVTTELQGAASGSGIGVLLTNPGATPDLVDLIAPVGTVDAGDAGIRASGGVFIAANTLLNAGNISAPSVSVGGGAAVTVSAPAAGGGASSSAAASSAALQAAQQSANTGQGNTAQNLPSIIIIDVIGLGEN